LSTLVVEHLKNRPSEAPVNASTAADMDVGSEVDSDVQQVAGKNYDPSHDKRDMKRLGKRQELKVGI